MLFSVHFFLLHIHPGYRDGLLFLQGLSVTTKLPERLRLPRQAPGINYLDALTRSMAAIRLFVFLFATMKLFLVFSSTVPVVPIRRDSASVALAFPLNGRYCRGAPFTGTDPLRDRAAFSFLKLLW